MILKPTVDLTVVGAPNGQISVITSNIQEIRVLNTGNKIFCVTLTLVSGRSYTLAEADGTYQYDTEAAALAAKQTFLDNLVTTGIIGDLNDILEGI